jgi:putative endonuclease
MGYYVYILKCSDGTFYTGYTTDVNKRVETHNKKRGAKYTRGRLPVKLAWHGEYDTKSEAMGMEYVIKQMSRSDKIGLIERYKH